LVIARCRAPSIRRRPISTRGTGHNEKSGYSERPDDFEKNMERINKKFETRDLLFRVLTCSSAVNPNRRSALSAYGTSHWAIIEARDQLRDEYNIEVDICG